MGITSPRAGATKCGWRARANGDVQVARGRGLPAPGYACPAPPSHHCDALEVRTPDRSDPVKDVTGWPANPNLVRHLKSTLIWTGVHVDEAVMGLSVHTDRDGGGDNPLLLINGYYNILTLGRPYSITRTRDAHSDRLRRAVRWCASLNAQ